MRKVTVPAGGVRLGDRVVIRGRSPVEVCGVLIGPGPRGTVVRLSLAGYGLIGPFPLAERVAVLR